MRKINTITLAIAASVLFAACSKKDSSTPSAAPSIIGNWQFSDFTEDTSMGNNPAMDLWAIATPCSKDNLWEFKTGGVFVLDEGATKCSASDDQSTAETWKQTDTKTLVIGTTNPLTATILTLDDSTLKLSFNGYHFRGYQDSIPAIETITFKRQ